MRFSNKWAISLMVAGILMAWCCVAGPAPKDKATAPAGKGLVVHEWGTFSTFSGSNGTNLKFDPYDNDLPDFVHGYLPKNSKAVPQGGTISLETPVIYFYSDRVTTASVRVDFPKGILTEWYPQAQRTDKRLEWQGVKVLPCEDVRLLSERKESRYYAARETDGTALRVAAKRDEGTEQEKFLFYRGVGTFDMPLSARALGDGEFRVRWTGETPEGDAILVRVQNGKVRFQPFHLDHPVTGGVRGDVRVPDRDSTVEQLGEAIIKRLLDKGLFEKEARAMVKTWRSAWFGEEGTRILYLLPSRQTEELLPLRVEPKPSALVRVLVGRHDILTPEREKQIDARVKQATTGTEAERREASEEMMKLGRYRLAAWREAESRLKNRR